VTSLTLSEGGYSALWIGGWEGTTASLDSLKERTIPNSVGEKNPRPSSSNHEMKDANNILCLSALQT
jgi:hypothetical protein